MGEISLAGPSRPRRRNITASDGISTRVAALQKQNAALVGVTANESGKARQPPASCVVFSFGLLTSLTGHSFHQTFKIASIFIIAVST